MHGKHGTAVRKMAAASPEELLAVVERCAPMVRCHGTNQLHTVQSCHLHKPDLCVGAVVWGRGCQQSRAGDRSIQVWAGSVHEFVGPTWGLSLTPSSVFRHGGCLRVRSLTACCLFVCGADLRGDGRGGTWHGRDGAVYRLHGGEGAGG